MRSWPLNISFLFSTRIFYDSYSDIITSKLVLGIISFLPSSKVTSATLTLEASDVDSDFLIIEVVSFPEHGQLGILEMMSDTTAGIDYTPAPGYRCQDFYTHTSIS